MLMPDPRVVESDFDEMARKISKQPNEKLVNTHICVKHLISKEEDTFVVKNKYHNFASS